MSTESKIHKPKEIFGVNLLDFSECAGWAGKMSPAVLADLLKLIPKKNHPNLLVGTETFDDAGIYKINDDFAVVFTSDFFSPVVDDPVEYGRISAANSFSDVYAMGGKPFLALNLIGFPSPGLPARIIADILIGAGEKTEEAGAVLAGGHTMNQTDIFFGLAVIGSIHPDKIQTNANAKTSDALILTKPLGSGILTTALKNGELEENQYNPVVQVMARLNKYAAEKAGNFRTHAMTDVTGYGFMGHLSEMMLGSGKTAVIDSDKIPLIGNVLKYAKMGHIPGGSKKNKEFCQDIVAFNTSTNEDFNSVLFDAQTSGGLLISVHAEDAKQLLDEIRKAGDKDAEIVGKIIDKQDKCIVLN